MRISDYFRNRADEIAAHGRKMTLTVAHNVVTVVVECPDSQGIFRTTIFEEGKPPQTS